METTGLNFKHWIQGAVLAQHSAQKLMDFSLMIGDHHIDEVSILLKSTDQQDRFLVWCRNNGIELFDSVDHDTFVSTGLPLDPTFGVRFDFLRLPNVDWRIEAVCITAGSAPLHDPIAEGCVVHASFKCAGLVEYERARTRLMQECADDYPVIAEYSNSYGRFSYAGRQPVYLKPRVNLRDI